MGAIFKAKTDALHFLYVISTANFKAMGKIIKYLALSVMALFFAISAANAQVPDEIITSLKTGNAQGLAKHFNQNVELVVLDTENVYSKAQAEQVLTDFFKKNPPQKFTIIHQGGKDDSSYVIGNLHVQTIKYRVYFLIKTKNNVAYIHQLRIEKEAN